MIFVLAARSSATPQAADAMAGRVDEPEAASRKWR
jgi:hypothetical protein